MALKHPAETPTKNLPETPPKTPKNDPWTGPSRVPGWARPGVVFGGFGGCL